MAAYLNGKLSKGYHGIYIHDENQPSGASMVHAVFYTVQRAEDKGRVYYMNYDNMRLYVYNPRAKKLNGCTMVRDTAEYMEIWNMLHDLGIAMADPPVYI